MGLYNVNQILRGARNAGGLKTYNLASVVDKPTAAIAGTTITFAGGSMEIEGKPYNFSTFDFAPFNALLKANTTYVLSAVPTFVEPADQIAAGLANVNYTISQTSLGESTLSYFLNPKAIAAVTALGGYDAVSQRVQLGTATNADFAAFSFYSSEREKLADPRYTGQRLPISDIKYVLTEVTPQNNASKLNALTSFTFNDFARFRASQGDIPAEPKTFDQATAIATYETPATTYLLKRIFGYTSLANANANINGVEVAVYDINTGALLPTPFTSPVGITSNVALVGQTFFNVFEYYYPSYMEPGNTNSKDKVLNILSVRDANGLGRINPIYLANPFNIQRSALMNAKARPALTLYNYPCSLVKVTVSAVGPVTLAGLTPAYDTMI